MARPMAPPTEAPPTQSHCHDQRAAWYELRQLCRKSAPCATNSMYANTYADKGRHDPVQSPRHMRSFAVARNVNFEAACGCEYGRRRTVGMPGQQSNLPCADRGIAP